jgi:uncharacterized protein
MRCASSSRGSWVARGIDDGALLLVAKDDRKLRIEVGYGLEGALNDATAKRIISETIGPRFKQGDFYGGIDAGVDAMIKVIGGEPLPSPSANAVPSRRRLRRPLRDSVVCRFRPGIRRRWRAARNLWPSSGGRNGRCRRRGHRFDADLVGAGRGPDRHRRVLSSRCCSACLRGAGWSSGGVSWGAAGVDVPGAVFPAAVAAFGGGGASGDW